MRLLFFFLLTSISVSAQLKGSIADIENQPIPYVNIYIENSYTGTTSNDNGDYVLALSKQRQTKQLKKTKTTKMTLNPYV